MPTSTDFTTTGLKIEGVFENDRNTENAQLFKDIIRKVYGVKDVICGHHLVYEKEDKRDDGFTYQIIEEIPSADSLIFDHSVAQILWGDGFKDVLMKLACEPCETRDKLLAQLYYGQTANNQA